MEIKKSAIYERLMIFFAAVVQVIGFIISITTEDFSKATLPYFYIIIPIINISCAVISFFLVIFIKFRILRSVILFIQGIAMTLNDKLFLGTVLYFIGIALLFSYGYLKSKPIRKIILSLAPLFLSFFAILPNDAKNFSMAWAYSLFLAFVEFHIYSTIKNSLYSLFPFAAKNFSTSDLPEHSESLNPKKYDLTERQVAILNEFMNSKKNYKELADLFLISESSIKREMREICKKFGVENATLLEILLKQYKIAY